MPIVDALLAYFSNRAEKDAEEEREYQQAMASLFHRPEDRSTHVYAAPGLIPEQPSGTASQLSPGTASPTGFGVLDDAPTPDEAEAVLGSLGGASDVGTGSSGGGIDFVTPSSGVGVVAITVEDQPDSPGLDASTSVDVGASTTPTAVDSGAQAEGAPPMTDHREVVAGQDTFNDFYDFTVRGGGPGVTSAVTLDITSHDTDSAKLTIPRGLQLVPAAPKVQVMVVVHPTSTPIEPGQTISITVPTLCASPFGYAPPSTDGKDQFHFSPTFSPVTVILDTIDANTEALVPMANSVGLGIDQFKSALGQYTTWALPWNTVEVVPAPDLQPSFDPSSPQTPGAGSDHTSTVGPDASGQDHGAPLEVPPPFTQDTIFTILNPQLKQNGATEDQVHQIATTFWGGVNLTMKNVEEQAPGTAQAIMAAGLPSTATTTGQ